MSEIEIFTLSALFN